MLISNSASKFKMALELMGPAFFIFFTDDNAQSSGGIEKPFRANRISGIPEDTRNENDEAVALALILFSCD